MKLHAASIVLALSVCGCRARAPESRPPPPPDPSVEVAGDPDVERDLETLNIRKSTSGKHTVLELDLRNRSSAALDFAWTVEWYDRSGKRIPGSARAWTPLSLDGGASASIQVPMPSPDATSWRLRAVRPG